MSDISKDEQAILAAMQADLASPEVEASVAALSDLEQAQTFKAGDRVTHKQGGPIEVGTVVETLTVALATDEGVTSIGVALVWIDAHRHAHAVKQKNLRHIA